MSENFYRRGKLRNVAKDSETIKPDERAAMRWRNYSKS